MKGIIFLGMEQVDFKEDLPQVDITTNEVLIKVKNVGICGSDVESYSTGGPYIPGNILGHEFSGEIVKIGSGVKKLKIGSRVTVNPQLPCGECYWCEHNQENMCRLQNYSLGTTEDGAMREFVNVKADRVHLLPDNVTFEEGAMVEPLAVAIYAVKESKFRIGNNAAVYGAGTIGLMTIQVLKNSGASNVYVIEPVESKQKRALELGADETFKPNAWTKIVRKTNKVGPDHIFDCVGIPETIINSLQLAKKGGHITLIGMHGKPFELKGILNLTTMNLTIRGVYGYNQDCYKTAINLLAKGKVNLKTMITKRIKLEDVPEIFKILANPPHEEIKVMIEI